MFGFLVIDKPQGLTSHAVVSRLRKLLNERRIGHTGTLDPMATGVLPVAVGEATRLIPFVHEGLKRYAATITLGSATNTQDAEGEVISTGDAGVVTPQDIQQVIDDMMGVQEQLPPMYSAIKIKGVPLYKLARKGEDVTRQARRIEVYQWLLESRTSEHLECVIDCSRGTYVRTLAHDLGAKLGCGAHLSALRRLLSGPFEIERSVSLEKVEELVGQNENLPWLNIQDVLPDRTPLNISRDAVLKLLDGIPPSASQVDDTLPTAGNDVLLMYQGWLVAAARYAPLREDEKRGDFELQRVFNQVREIMQ